MFEEINRSGDGGSYGELIANRAMLDKACAPPSRTWARGSVMILLTVFFSVASITLNFPW
jgi:hypothetical protein